MVYNVQLQIQFSETK